VEHHPLIGPALVVQFGFDLIGLIRQAYKSILVLLESLVANVVNMTCGDQYGSR